MYGHTLVMPTQGFTAMLCPAAITQLFQSLGRAGAPLATRLLESLGQLCAGAAEAEDAGDAAAPVASPARAALGAAVRCLGPEAVLDALPLQLQEVCYAVTSVHMNLCSGCSNKVLFEPCNRSGAQLQACTAE